MTALRPATPPVSVCRPSVAVVLPTLNERATIVDCLGSILAQDYSAIREVLVVDGGSTDGTREIVQRYPAPVRLVENAGVTAAAAMNVGISQVTTDVICRADAHTIYTRSYVRRCVEVLRETGATNVGGRMNAVGTTSFGRAVAAITSSPFGVGPGRFHYGLAREEVDTVYLGCWPTDSLRSLGGFDEERLQWGAEDQELNFRIRSAGLRVVLDPAIVSWYFPRETPEAVFRQYFNYGLAKASTLAKHRRLPSWRPLVPSALVAATAAALVLSRGRYRVAVPGLHAVACAAAALKVSAGPGVAPHRAFAAAEICHWSYGLGFWAGITRIVTGRAFDTRPVGHR